MVSNVLTLFVNLPKVIYSLTYGIEGVFRGCGGNSFMSPCNNDESKCPGANICVCDNELCNDVCNDSNTATTATTEILMLAAASLCTSMHSMERWF